jgi:hypothetical protein
MCYFGSGNGDCFHRNAALWQNISLSHWHSQGEGGGLQLTWAAASNGLENEYFKFKSLYFLHITDLKLLSEIKGNSVNVFDFFKTHNFC